MMWQATIKMETGKIPILVFIPSYPQVWPGLIDSLVKTEYGRNEGMSFPKSK